MRNQLVVVMCCCLLAFAMAFPAEADAAALEQGLVLIGGGCDASGWFDVFTTSDTINTSIDVFGWGGYTLAGGMNIGPYLGIWWSSSEDAAAGSGNTSLSINPGFQLSYYTNLGSILLFSRSVTRIIFWSGSSTISGSTTEYDFQLSGFSSQLNVGASFMITDYLLMDVGPALYYYLNRDASYYRMEVGLELGLVVLL